MHGSKDRGDSNSEGGESGHNGGNNSGGEVDKFAPSGEGSKTVDRSTLPQPSHPWQLGNKCNLCGRKRGSASILCMRSLMCFPQPPLCHQCHNRLTTLPGINSWPSWVARGRE